MSSTMTFSDTLKTAAHPIVDAATDFDPLMEQIGEAQFVLIGEATHGTHEFYRVRADITKRLITEKGFTALAVEADWPDAYRINRYVRGVSEDHSSIEALADFKRFPAWMWRNDVVLDFVEWLRNYNDSLPSQQRKVGFYGLDLYSLYRSIEAVLEYLDRVDPEAAQRARYRYGCLEHFGEDSQAYGYATYVGMSTSCEAKVMKQLIELQNRAVEYKQKEGLIPEDEYFYVEQNARLVRNAEEYYRTMFGGRVSSWNLRDRHMAETLDHLVTHLNRQGQPTKVVVWEHNSHIGDARATDMGEAGELNVGQLVRQRYDDVVLVGFTTYTGTVTAASAWGTSAEKKQVQEAIEGSYEALFHEAEFGNFLLNLQQETEAVKLLRSPRLERAIGVIYLPQTERISHYFRAQLPQQFDALIHFDETHAVKPLELTNGWQGGDVPETFPSAL